MERVDIKLYCLELEANGRQYLVALQFDGELYEWQDDMYMRSAGGAVSQPYGFTHVGYVGWEARGGLRVARQTARAMLKLPPAPCSCIALADIGLAACDCGRDIWVRMAGKAACKEAPSSFPPHQFASQMAVVMHSKSPRVHPALSTRPWFLAHSLSPSHT
jgi:hypothetical protein